MVCGNFAAPAQRAALLLSSVPQSAIVRDVLPSGLRILTERMPHVRSVSIGVWLARGSRHEPAEQSGIAHFVEHMLFKGTATRSAENIAQTIAQNPASGVTVFVENATSIARPVTSSVPSASGRLP